MFERLKNIGLNSLKRKNFGVMAEKVKVRLQEHLRAGEEAEHSLEWCKAHAENGDEFLADLDPDLWKETQEACAVIAANGKKKLDALGMNLGGGGHYPLLYFLTRRLKPETVVETGVAAGWSSQALLTALKTNEKDNNVGRLYSSDFPYFRYENPEKYIGYVVDDDLKKNWKLYIDGDKNNLPRIAGEVNAIDLFHYDSDKSYAGREFAIKTVESKLTRRAIVIFDDIQDNLHFCDYVDAKRAAYKIFEFGGKYAGLVGDL